MNTTNVDGHDAVAGQVERPVRRLGDVLDALLAEAPDLAAVIGGIRASVRYASPEAQGYWWHEAAAALNAGAADHPRRDRIARIFSGA